MSSQYEWLYQNKAEEIAEELYGCEFSELSSNIQADVYQEAMRKVSEASA